MATQTVATPTSPLPDLIVDTSFVSGGGPVTPSGHRHGVGSPRPEDRFPQSMLSSPSMPSPFTAQTSPLSTSSPNASLVYLASDLDPEQVVALRQWAHSKLLALTGVDLSFECDRSARSTGNGQAAAGTKQRFTTNLKRFFRSRKSQDAQSPLPGGVATGGGAGHPSAGQPTGYPPLPAGAGGHLATPGTPTGTPERRGLTRGSSQSSAAVDRLSSDHTSYGAGPDGSGPAGRPSMDGDERFFSTSVARATALWGVSFSPRRLFIPHPIRSLFTFLYRNDRIGQDGLFRINGSQRRIQDLKRILDENPMADLSTIRLPNGCLSANDVASLIKSYFSSQAEPLLTNQFERICEFIAAEDSHSPRALQAMQYVFMTLPAASRDLFEALLRLLHTVASADGMMNASNLALVFAPCFLSAASAMDLHVHRIVVETTTAMISRTEEVCTILPWVLDQAPDLVPSQLGEALDEGASASGGGVGGGGPAGSGSSRTPSISIPSPASLLLSSSSFSQLRRSVSQRTTSSTSTTDLSGNARHQRISSGGSGHLTARSSPHPSAPSSPQPILRASSVSSAGSSTLLHRGSSASGAGGRGSSSSGTSAARGGGTGSASASSSSIHQDVGSFGGPMRMSSSGSTSSAAGRGGGSSASHYQPQHHLQSCSRVSSSEHITVSGGSSHISPSPPGSGSPNLTPDHQGVGGARLLSAGGGSGVGGGSQSLSRSVSAHTPTSSPMAGTKRTASTGVIFANDPSALSAAVGGGQQSPRRAGTAIGASVSASALHPGGSEAGGSGVEEDTLGSSRTSSMATGPCGGGGGGAILPSYSSNDVNMEMGGGHNSSTDGGDGGGDSSSSSSSGVSDDSGDSGPDVSSSSSSDSESEDALVATAPASISAGAGAGSHGVDAALASSAAAAAAGGGQHGDASEPCSPRSGLAPVAVEDQAPASPVGSGKPLPACSTPAPLILPSGDPVNSPPPVSSSAMPGLVYSISRSSRLRAAANAAAANAAASAAGSGPVSPEFAPSTPLPTIESGVDNMPLVPVSQRRGVSQHRTSADVTPLPARLP
ncbi:hypothetical protein H696_01601 [Fonticula alba]|uniref:Rho-GAP domain-containing protein n=1 Tax=Fonticula alba TaxID=691883 RepID=A0A058ZFE7_FONAL|nr:hypothetical protein H696_01601 [Fonticula alba]KCV72202.1 hypothetical protein H696_01601 [Fonticula alba]|eukprot:XP_009493780.1 hypothetical protein H696_01601 [Fonticula alba]